MLKVNTNYVQQLNSKIIESLVHILSGSIIGSWNYIRHFASIVSTLFLAIYIEYPLSFCFLESLVYRKECDNSKNNQAIRIDIN